MQAELSGSLLHVAPVKAGHSIADALGRQKGKKALALGSAASAGQQNKPVSQTGTLRLCLPLGSLDILFQLAQAMYIAAVHLA